MQAKILGAAALAAQTLAQEQKDSCLALALNGGGSKGAYQAGVIYGLMHEGDPADFEWDVVTGISAGAINTAALSVWAPEDGLAMSEWFSDTWAAFTTKDVFTIRPDGPLEWLLDEVSLLDDTPLPKFIDTTLADFDGVKRRAVVGTVDANTGTYQRWNLHEIPQE